MLLVCFVCRPDAIKTQWEIMKKINYSIRCTDKQKEIIQAFAKKMDRTIINSLLTAIDHYDHKKDIDSIDKRIEQLKLTLAKLEKKAEQI